MAGLSAAWSLRREGHRVQIFERNYKPGGRMNSRRKAGLIVDHGDRFIYRNSPVLRELIVDCGLHGESRPIEKPILTAREDGSFTELAGEAGAGECLTFPDGMLMLPEALRRSLGGFYSIGVTAIERDDALGKFFVRTEPPLRSSEAQADAVIVACAASEALKVSEPVRGLLHKPFVEKMAAVRYTRCLTLIAALAEIRPPLSYYGVEIPPGVDSAVKWIGFEDQKCRGRAIEGWSSLVAHATPQASEEFWRLDEEKQIAKIYAGTRKIVPQLPEELRWARIKRWEIARLQDPAGVVDPETCPAAPDDVLLEFCGDYRVGDGVEPAARSGRDAAERLLRKMAKR